MSFLGNYAANIYGGQQLNQQMQAQQTNNQLGLLQLAQAKQQVADQQAMADYAKSDSMLKLMQSQDPMAQSQFAGNMAQYALSRGDSVDAAKWKQMQSESLQYAQQVKTQHLTDLGNAAYSAQSNPSDPASRKTLGDLVGMDLSKATDAQVQSVAKRVEIQAWGGAKVAEMDAKKQEVDQRLQYQQEGRIEQMRHDRAMESLAYKTRENQAFRADLELHKEFTPESISKYKKSGNMDDLVPRSGAAGVGGANAVMQANRIVGATEQASQDIKNVADFVQRGAISLEGFKTEGHGILDATKDALVNKSTPQLDQMYAKSTTGLSRSLATIEGQGVATGLVGLVKSIEGQIQAKPGDTIQTKLFNLAQIRQIVDTGVMNLKDRKILTPEQESRIDAFQQQVRDAVPFTTTDVRNFSESAGKNQSFYDYLKGGGGVEVAGKIKRGPAVGEVDDGYRFKGGDPAQPSSWEKVVQ